MTVESLETAEEADTAITRLDLDVQGPRLQVGICPAQEDSAKPFVIMMFRLKHKEIVTIGSEASTYSQYLCQ